MEKISIVVPCYNEEQAIPLFYKAITSMFSEMNVKYELIFVDDGSRDKTLEILRELSKEKNVKYISFSRNFGKEAAMLAGLREADGDFIAPMDVDLQDPPSLIPVMYDILKNEDFDYVGTRRATRKGEPKIRSFFARMFYKLINKMSKVDMVDGARDFRLMKKCVVDAILSMKEYNRYSKGLFSFVGFKAKWLEYENIERVAGTTKWNFWKLFIYAIEGIVSFSIAPLSISIFIGFVTFLTSIILLIIMLFTKFTSLMILITILTNLFGISFIILGIIGIYLSKLFLEVKNRPVYIIREKN